MDRRTLLFTTLGACVLPSVALAGETPKLLRVEVLEYPAVAVRYYRGYASSLAAMLAKGSISAEMRPKAEAELKDVVEHLEWVEDHVNRPIRVAHYSDGSSAILPGSGLHDALSDRK